MPVRGSSGKQIESTHGAIQETLSLPYLSCLGVANLDPDIHMNADGWLLTGQLKHEGPAE